MSRKFAVSYIPQTRQFDVVVRAPSESPDQPNISLSLPATADDLRHLAESIEAALVTQKADRYHQGDPPPRPTIISSG